MNLRPIRKSAHLTQQQLADKSGIHRVTIARIESNNHSTTTDTAAKIASALGCTIDELMGSPAHTPTLQHERA